MKRILIVSLLALPCIAAAKSGDSNNCGKLSVVIANTTNNTCTIVNSNLIHGFYTYTSNTPAFIPAHSTTNPIFLTQSFYGPELELSYDCQDNKTITFTSKQNACVLSSGNIQGTVNQIENMKADFQTNQGSYIWSQSGSISWRLE